MTDEEVNKRFDIVAGHLATLAVGLDTLREQVSSLAGNVGRVSEKLDRTADGITSLLAVAEIHDREIVELAESVRAVDERTRRTDERLDALINTVERLISDRQNGKG